MKSNDVTIGDEAIEIRVETREYKVVGIEKDPLGLIARDRMIVEDGEGVRHIRMRMDLSKKKKPEPPFKVGDSVRIVDLFGAPYGFGTVMEVLFPYAPTPQFVVEMAPGDCRQFSAHRLRPLNG